MNAPTTKRKLVGYEDCRCVLTQYCDGKCRPIFADVALSDAPHRRSADTEGTGQMFPNGSSPAASPILAAPASEQGEREAFAKLIEVAEIAMEGVDPGDQLWPMLDEAITNARASLRASPAVPVAQDEREAPSVDAAYYMGAKGGQANEAERLAFEAWMRGHCWALCAEWTGTQYLGSSEQGGDVDPRAMMTRRLWAAWRDRAALSAATPPAGTQSDTERDAARYRWLREQDWFSGPLAVLREPKRVLTQGIGLGADCPSHHRLDAAIDAAMGTQPADKENGK